jgi:hypothetical protein
MVRQRGEVAELVFMLVSQPIQRTQENDRRRKHLIASNPEWEIDMSGFKLAVPSRISAAARPKMGAFGVGLYKEGSTAHEETKRPSKGVLGQN